MLCVVLGMRAAGEVGRKGALNRGCRRPLVGDVPWLPLCTAVRASTWMCVWRKEGQTAGGRLAAAASNLPLQPACRPPCEQPLQLGGLMLHEGQAAETRRRFCHMHL